MKTIERSRKAKEVHAEQLLKISTSLLTAFFVIILIVPISTIVAASFNDTYINPKDVFLNLFSSWYAVVFLVSEVVLLTLLVKIKNDAYDIYDDLYPDKKTDRSNESEG
ncbi:MAG: hypothetical protein HRT54_15925 [Colwellia sp.]|nr:hypothetical protein [Colwellia sp.]